MAKKQKQTVKKGGKGNAFKDSPFQLGEGERWFKDSRPKGKTFVKKG